MDEQRQDDQLKPTYNSSVPIRDVTLKICRKRWTIGKGNGRGSGISVLRARHDDRWYIWGSFKKFKSHPEFRFCCIFITVAWATSTQKLSQKSEFVFFFFSFFLVLELPHQKCSSTSFLSGWGLELFECPSCIVVIYYVFCLDMTQRRMNGAHNENRIHSWSFVSQAC